MAAKDTVEKTEMSVRTTENMGLKVQSSHDRRSLNVPSNIESSSFKVL